MTPDGAPTMSSECKKVYLEPPWRYHAYASQLASSPPSGYEFILQPKKERKVWDRLSRSDIGHPSLQILNSIMPTSLVKSWFDRVHPAPRATALTYAFDHLVLRPEPWVVEVEYASLLLSANPKHFPRFKTSIEKALSSTFCRKIICWSSISRQGLIQDLDSSKFANKIELVNYAVPSRRFGKQYDTSKPIRLLMTGSGTSKGGFDARGGREVIEMFVKLRERFPELELVIRSDVPTEIKRQWHGTNGITIIESLLPANELDAHFRSADIFVLPSHTTLPTNILDAMSYGLPVVTLDSWANNEFVKDGVTGFVVGQSTNRVRGRTDHQPNWGTSTFERSWRVTNPLVVADLVEKMTILIENSDLRRKMGETGLKNIEKGKFSIVTRNARLKQIFDEAISISRY